VIPGFKPFDAVELARKTEEIVCRGDAKKYTDFYVAGVYGGIATGYACGCCLRCVFCWVGWSRDFPERYGKFYSAEKAFSKLRAAASTFGVRKVRISGAEPTLGKEHLLALLSYIEKSELELFILETNGILFGVDSDYVKAISEFSKTHVRVSLKAGDPQSFTRKTGARPECFELPFKAIEHLIASATSFHVAAMSADPRIMSKSERVALATRLAEIDTRLLINLEEEVIDPYDTTLARLRYAGLKMEWPLRKTYPSIRFILNR
jgi:uncharacterized Fe-S cluster-containing radical SAM superfamily protein